MSSFYFLPPFCHLENFLLDNKNLSTETRGVLLGSTEPTYWVVQGLFDLSCHPQLDGKNCPMEMIFGKRLIMSLLRVGSYYIMYF